MWTERKILEYLLSHTVNFDQPTRLSSATHTHTVIFSRQRVKKIFPKFRAFRDLFSIAEITNFFFLGAVLRVTSQHFIIKALVSETLRSKFANTFASTILFQRIPAESVRRGAEERGSFESRTDTIPLRSFLCRTKVVSESRRTRGEERPFVE